MHKTRISGLFLVCLFLLVAVVTCGGSTPTEVPTPMPPASETLRSEAASLCNAAFAQAPDSSAAPLAEILTEASLLSLFSSAREDDAWQVHIPMLPFLQAVFAKDVRYVLCVRETKNNEGQYDDGDFGYRLDWSVRLIQWPDGQVLAAADWLGGDPPKTKQAGSGPGYGMSPAGELTKWVSRYFSAQTLFSHKGDVGKVAFSPDGSMLAVGGGCAVGLWEPATGQQVRMLDGYSEPVAYSSDGALLASSHGCDRSAIALLDPDTGQQVRILKGLRGLTDLSTVAFSPDGEILASGERDGKIKIWDIAAAKAIHTLDAHTDVVRSVAFSPDGAMLASAGLDDMLKLWDVATGTELRVFGDDRYWKTSVAFSPDGATLASGGWDAVRLWDVATGKQIRSKVIYDHDRRHVNDVTFSPDGNLLAVASSGGDSPPATPWEGVMAHCITVLDAKNFQTTGTLCGHTNKVNSLVFSPDGNTLASGSDDGFAKLWDMTAEP